MAPAQLCEK
ncbi:Protein of unknown function [Bacillus mycoides]|nr:Protein of unknown function [Bacillus mycoides]